MKKQFRCGTAALEPLALTAGRTNVVVRGGEGEKWKALNLYSGVIDSKNIICSDREMAVWNGFEGCLCEENVCIY